MEKKMVLESVNIVMGKYIKVIIKMGKKMGMVK